MDVSLESLNSFRPRTGTMEAVIRWVESGQAPDQLMAERRDAKGKLISQRPLFPYPQITKYKGRGSPDDAANFVSETPVP